jgi:Mrp family chromosome partitioning ATPase
MDCDIRKGALHEPLDLFREPGVTEMLHDGSSDPAGFISPTPVPNLHLLPTGRLNQGHSDVFLGPSLDALLEYARANYDCVIVDSAPVFAADDTTTLAPKMDAVLFVLRSGYTRARLARQALNALYQRQVNVLGLIVNRLNPHQRSYYYYKYAEYYADTGKRRSRRRRESERRPSATPQAEPPPVPASR